MAVKHDKTNEIITLTAAADEVVGQLELEGILLSGTADGASVLQDNNGNTLLAGNLTAAVRTLYVPCRRRVTGVRAMTLAANHTFYVYLKKYV